MQAGEKLEEQQIRGEYEVQWLLAESPDTRAQLPALAESYVADTLGIVTTADGKTLHRWVIEFSRPETASALKNAFEQALSSESNSMTANVTVSQSVLVTEW